MRFLRPKDEWSRPFESAEPLPTWVAVAAAAMAIGIQVQTTAHIGDSLIRLAIADLFVPVIFVIALAHSTSLFTVRWRVRHIWAWLGVLSATFTIALVLGRIGAGEWIRWAVVNKYAGWYVLLMYFLVGGWLAAAYGESGRRAILKALLVFFWVSCALVGLRCGPDTLGLGSVVFLDFTRFQAFMENPNAFGILAALAIALQAPYLASGSLFGRALHVIGLTVALIALMYSGSRSAWLGFGLGALVLTYTRSVSVRPTLLAGVLASLIGFTPIVPLMIELGGLAGAMAAREESELNWALIQSRAIHQCRWDREVAPGTIDPARLTFSDKDFAMRMRSAKVALGMWQENPILGVGLGGYIASEKRKGAILAPAAPAGGDRGRQFILIHNSAIWLLTETGLLGAVAFIGFFFACFLAFRRDLRSGTGDPLSAGMFAGLFVFAGASMGTEVLYQRHFWFLLGCAVAIPRAKSRGCRNPERANELGRTN